MEKEIGGYLQLEEFSGKDYYDTLYKVNLGRTALLWLVQSRHCKKILLPYFLCSSVINVCSVNSIEVEFYNLDDTLTPIISPSVLTEEGTLKDDIWLYLVNYYGQLSNQKILALQKQYKQIIVDNTQSFYQPPLEGIDTLYSCRKFFGVSDGAYLSTDAQLLTLEAIDCSHHRMAHILGRYEENASAYYQEMLDTAATYDNMGIRKMSKLTHNLLKAIDYETVRLKRVNNYIQLSTLLPSDNQFTGIIPDGPFAYPYYHANGILLRKKLASRKIFIPTNWSNVIKSMPQHTREYQWAANILPLPCDQRYGKDEMKYLAEVILEEEKTL